MTDIVPILRYRAEEDPAAQVAADEIELLREQCEANAVEYKALERVHFAIAAERDALRTAGDRLADESFSPLEALAAWREVRGTE